MLPISRDDGKLLTMFTESVELVGKRSLQLFTGDVGQLSFCDERFGFSTDKFLFEHNDTRAVGFLVLKLSNLIGNLLLSVSTGLHRGFDVANALDGYTILIIAIDKLVFELADFVNQDSQLVRYVRNVIITCLAPD